MVSVVCFLVKLGRMMEGWLVGWYRGRYKRCYQFRQTLLKCTSLMGFQSITISVFELLTDTTAISSSKILD